MAPTYRAMRPSSWEITLGMTPEEESLIEQAEAKVVSLGATSLHADYCVVIVNRILDTGMVADR